MLIFNKLIGVFAILVGFWFLKYFPDISGYQKREMTMTGILIGIILLLIGIGLLVFG